VIRLTLASAWGRRRRLASICVAVALGVAFLSGTLVVGDTLRHNFNTLFTDASAQTDVVVRNATEVKKGGAPDSDVGLINESLLTRVRAVPGVADAEGQVVGYGTLLGANGQGIGGNGPPRQAGSWLDDPALNPYRLVAGRAPRAPAEVVINRGAAKAGDLHVGDTTTVQVPDPVRVHIVGIATFGTADGLGSATWTAFTLPAAQQLVTRSPNKVTSIYVKGEPGVASATLRDRIAAQVPPGVQAITGTQLTQERVADINSTFLNALRSFLVAFAVIALIVATLTINNTFSIVVAQRTRELALLRAVGASRRQLRRSVTLEATLAGAVSAVVGVIGGLGLAELLVSLFSTLPSGGLTVRPTSIVIGLAVGVLVTVVAAQLPSRRAASLPPVAALRDTAHEPRGIGRGRVVAGAALLAVGVATAVVGATGVTAIALVAALALIVGVLLLAPLALPPVARVLGRALERLRGAPAAFAVDNAQRNPRRSASTATALVVGAAVVALITVVVTSLESTLEANVRAPFAADLAISTPQFGGAELSPRVVGQIGALPQVSEAIGVGQGPALVDGKSTNVTNTDVAAIERVVRVTDRSGSLRALGPSQIGVSQTKAGDEHWHVGTPIAMKFSDGVPVPTTVGAIYASNALLGDVVVPTALANAHIAQPTDREVLVLDRPGVSTDAAREAITPIAERYGGEVQDQAQYATAAASGLRLLLNLVYVLLLIAIVIALLGIANTLSLSVYERQREIGLLRAVGQTRRQTRSVLRIEALIVAAFGTLLGVGLGTFIGWSVFEALGTVGAQFSLPVSRLVLIVVIGSLASALAAWRPARRAARVPILDAIAVR
jgi:putative ABC transport system permease protein